MSKQYFESMAQMCDRLAAGHTEFGRALSVPSGDPEVDELNAEFLEAEERLAKFYQLRAEELRGRIT
jgi:hypothetical protein